MNKEVVQNIFKIRSKVMDVIMNRKNQFETFECEVCSYENETQEHIYECKKIWKIKEKIFMGYPKYEEILWGNKCKQKSTSSKNIFRKHENKRTT